MLVITDFSFPLTSNAAQAFAPSACTPCGCVKGRNLLPTFTPSTPMVNGSSKAAIAALFMCNLKSGGEETQDRTVNRC